MFAIVVTMLGILVGFAAPSRAATWSIGPNLGFDVYKQGSGDALLILSVPSGAAIELSGVRPGLRLGLRDRTNQHQVFSDLGIITLAGSGFSLNVTSASLNYAIGRAPYLTVGFGFTSIGGDVSSETITTIGFGVGGRHRLAHGHGRVRVEGRYDRADASGWSDPANILGVRVGFDLDLN
jgi:hypothetical protein